MSNRGSVIGISIVSAIFGAIIIGAGLYEKKCPECVSPPVVTTKQQQKKTGQVKKKTESQSLPGKVFLENFSCYQNKGKNSLVLFRNDADEEIDFVSPYHAYIYLKYLRATVLRGHDRNVDLNDIVNAETKQALDNIDTDAARRNNYNLATLNNDLNINRQLAKLIVFLWIWTNQDLKNSIINLSRDQIDESPQKKCMGINIIALLKKIQTKIKQTRGDTAIENTVNQTVRGIQNLAKDALEGEDIAPFLTEFGIN